jgi:hypothetical protein
MTDNIDIGNLPDTDNKKESKLKRGLVAVNASQVLADISMEEKKLVSKHFMDTFNKLVYSG